MKILIAIDDSTHSERALDFVARMRWPAGSRVIVVSALQPAVAVGVGAFELAPVSAELLERQRRHAEVLVHRAQRTLNEAGLATTHHILPGDPREALIQIAESERADLLVV